MLASLALLSLLPLSLSSPIISEIFKRQTTTTCATGVHIIAARGSTEAPGEGKCQSVSQLIEAGIPGSDDVAVVYPATLLPYESSEEAGVTNMTQMVQSYAQACPDTKMVLVGFSQGAQVVGDVLGGGSFTSSPPLASQYTKNIIAALQFGDPAHVAGKPYNKGNGTHDGIFPRSDTTTLDGYGAILQSWCDDGDPVCDDGLHLSVHENEIATNQDAAVQFVVQQAQVAGLTVSRKRRRSAVLRG